MKLKKILSTILFQVLSLLRISMSVRACRELLMLSALIFSSNCLRLYVDRDLDSFQVVNPITKPAQIKVFSENSLDVKEVKKENRLEVYINFYIRDYKLIKENNLVKYAIRPVGYNLNFSTTAIVGCFRLEGPMGGMKKYWIRLPFHTLLTLGVQIPFSILDYISLPIRMYPYYKYEKKEYETLKIINEKNLNDTEMKEFQILYYDNLQNLISTEIVSDKKISISKNQIFIPYFNKEHSVTIKNTINNSHHIIRFNVPEKTEEIIFILE